MHTIDRRAFLATSATALGAAALLRPSLGAATAATAKATVGFRIFAPDWTLDKRCDPAAYELAARIGLDGVQVDFGWPPEGGGRPPLFAEAKQNELMASAARHGVAISSLALGAVNRTPYKSSAEGEQWALDAIAVLRRMKLRVVLLPFFNKGDLIGDPAGLEEVIRRLRRLAPRAEEAGVIFGIESWLKVPELERIMDAVKSPAVQVYYDIGNMQKVDENVGAAIRQLGRERICEVHLKDYDDLYGKGSMDFPAVRAALDAIHYRGWVGIEGTKTPLGVEQSIRYDLDYLRPLFPRKIG
ncbi:MAG: sugar phosphate isomerase/epimerase [Opitutaceae bacterium]|nr:sugar phosphate isomerase/epimerase [Opitutaceae bacterium]